jgi:hypothetical protein
MGRSPAVRFARALLAGWVVFAAAAAGATPLDLISVGDPLEDEIRILEVLGAPGRLPRLGTRPLQVVDLPSLDRPMTGAAAIARTRLLRALARDRAGRDSIPGATPRLLQLAYPDDQRLEFSAGLEAGGTVARERDPELASASGLRLRFAAQTGRWLAYSHVIAGYVNEGTSFAERIVPRNEAILHSEESYLAYTGTHERWAAVVGRGRWHWGPGQEASLLLSRTSSPLAGFALRVRIEPLRADGTILSATLGHAAGEQLAAHRLEWQPLDGLRLGLSEGARYQASTWQPLYLVGVLPYAVAQNLLVQDEPDSSQALRNNVVAAFDVAWRVAPGTRVYAEVLVDDVKTDGDPVVNKYAYQLGWEGVGTVRGHRVSWGAEYTRLTRYVYTSFFGRSFALGDVPLGFPTGPDARRVRVRGTWDPSADWQVFASAARTDLGESGLGVPFVPGSSVEDPGTFAGIVETSRDLEVGVRYWPASGVDLTLSAGHLWVDDAGHLPGSRRREPRASVSVRWLR